MEKETLDSCDNLSTSIDSMKAEIDEIKIPYELKDLGNKLKGDLLSLSHGNANYVMNAKNMLELAQDAK